MANQFLNNKSKDYYNQKALKHAVIVTFLYIFIDFFIIDYSQKLDYSSAFYFKCLIVGFYSLSSSQLAMLEIEESENYSFVHDLSGAILCIWVACVDYFLLVSSTSYFSALFMLVAIFTSFNCLIKLPFVLERKANSIWVFRVSMVFIQLLLVSELVLLLLIIVNGEWVWIFHNPFYLISLIANG